MKKLISFLILIFLIINTTYANNYKQTLETSDFQKKLLTFGDNTCQNIQETDIPTIFIPGIMASWYSEYGFEGSKIKRWIPDPITHSYDTLFYTFKQNGYELKDVFYEDEYNLKIEGNPKKSLYLFGYDWKKDNKITATLLNQLISKIRKKYLEENGCDISAVNIIAHSMGGIIARTMLEDMCVNDEELQEYKKTNLTSGQLFNFTSVKCKDQTKINKLITIGTPHRGSPKVFPIWEKGEISQVENFTLALGLKSQLSDKNILEISDYIPEKQLYNRVHGYDTNIPNGIVTIGQLLPDIGNEIASNIKYQYLEKKDYYIGIQAYPKNSFLEELNKTANIDKMWDKINSDYTSYFSTITSNDGKNNIIGFNLMQDKTIYDDELGKDIYYDPDDTQNIIGKDIYDNYNDYLMTKSYVINNTIRNQKWLGGDGTVPTYNGLLIANDSVDGKQVKNEKFKSEEIICYDLDLIQENGYSNYQKIENYLYKNFGEDNGMGICSHTKLPIGTAIKVYINISGNNIIKAEDKKTQIQKERELLLSYLGHMDYVNNEEDGINSNTKINELFEKKGTYKKVLNKEEISYFLEEDININNRILLDFGGRIKNLRKYEVLSPINIKIINEKGQHIGVNPETGLIENTIPGAWTSGNTEGSKEGEFFLIPITGTGETNNIIQTYGTGDGEYHIVIEDIDLLGEENIGEEKLIINGQAKDNFGEDFLVNLGGNETTYTNITEKISSTLDIDNTDVKTQEDIYQIRYVIRGKSDEIKQIKYTIIKDDKKTLQKTEEIDGKIDINISENGKYNILIELLDNNGELLKNDESKKVINIEKTSKEEEILKNDSSFIQKTNTGFLDKELINNLQKKEEIFEITTEQSDFGIKLFSQTGSIVNSNFGSLLSTNFSYNFYYDKYTKKVEVLLANNKANIFEYNNNFEYEKLIDNDLSITEGISDIKILDKGNNIEYIFDKNNFKLTSINNFSDIGKIELFYNTNGKLDYITDNKTNTYFYFYDENNGLIKSIKDIYENTVEFDYGKIGNFDVLNKISSGNNIFTFIFDKNGIKEELLNKDGGVINFKKIKNNIIYDIKDEKIILNNNSQIIYKKGLDGNLYSIFDKKVYKINKNNGKKELIIENNKKIFDIFISSEGELYIFDGKLKYLLKSGKIKILIKNFDYDISDFFVLENEFYFLDKYKKGYFVYKLENDYVYNLKKDKYINNIGLNGNNIYVIDDFSTKDYLKFNPEFEIKYNPKLQKIKTKLNNEFSIEQKQKIKKIFVSGKDGYLDKIKNEYKKIEYEYIIDKIVELL